MTNEQAQARKEMIATTLACLKYGWKIEKIGETNGSAIVRGGFPNTDWYYICDNGGEFNVGRINHDGEMRSIAYTNTSYFDLLDGGTMAYRVAMVMRGEEIDYAFRLADIVEDARKAA